MIHRYITYNEKVAILTRDGYLNFFRKALDGIEIL